MNVACGECRSIFRVDPTKIPSTGVRARCSVCQGVITIGAGELVAGHPVSPLRQRLLSEHRGEHQVLADQMLDEPVDAPVHALSRRGPLVRPDGIDLTYLPLVIEETFFRQARYHEFDASEMSLSSYVLSLFADNPQFIAIPVFPSRAFP